MMRPESIAKEKIAAVVKKAPIAQVKANDASNPTARVIDRELTNVNQRSGAWREAYFWPHSVRPHMACRPVSSRVV